MSEETKRKALEELKKAMFDDDDMGLKDLLSKKKLKKVTIASDSDEGLKEGIMKASELLEDEDEDDEKSSKKKKLESLFGDK